MNRCNYIGTLGRDWEITYSGDGKSIAKNSLAVKKYNKETLWVNLVAFGARGENLAKYTGKGSQLGVETQLDINDYEKDGVKRQYYSFIIDNFTFVGSKQDNGQSQNQGGGYQQQSKQQNQGQQNNNQGQQQHDPNQGGGFPGNQQQDDPNSDIPF